MSAGKMAATASEKKPPEPPRFYVLYGNREAEINEAKLEIARRLIPNEADRRENIVEIAPPATAPLSRYAMCIRTWSRNSGNPRCSARLAVL
jgi:hypothetical protein